MINLVHSSNSFSSIYKNSQQVCVAFSCLLIQKIKVVVSNCLTIVLFLQKSLNQYVFTADFFKKYVERIFPVFSKVIKKTPIAITQGSCPKVVQPIALSITHQNLLDIGNGLGYSLNDDGACRGIALMGMQSAFIRDVSSFNKRLGKFSNLIKIHKENIENVVKSIKEDPNFLSECLAFFDGISLWQQPDLHAEWFGKEAVFLSQKDSEAIALITMSQELESKGGIDRILSFSGVYNLEEFLWYLGQIRKIVDEAFEDMTIAVVLNDNSHSIPIAYDAKKNWWFIDSNQLPIKEIKEDAELTEYISNGFETKTFIIHSEFFCLKRQSDFLKRALEMWKDTDEFKQVHRVTSEKARELGPYKGSWLFFAVKEQDRDLVQSLLTLGADPNETNNKEYSHILQAVCDGNVEIVKMLLAAGIHPSFDIKGSNFLRLIIPMQNLEMIRAFLTAGADPNYSYDLGCSLKEKVEQDTKLIYLEIHDMLLERQKMMPGAQDFKGIINRVRRGLISEKKGINKANFQRMNHLCSAFFHNNLQIVQMLLDSGADPNPSLTNFIGLTPLYLAVVLKDLRMVRALLSKGANPNIPNFQGVTPIYLAVLQGDVRIVKSLLPKVPKSQYKKYRGMADIAKAMGYNKLEKLLLELK